MVPEQFRDFAQGFVAIVLFLSNFLFWWKEDYFAPAAEENPLLHTWTLAVEEQFYLFFPLLLLALWCFGKRLVFYIVISLSLISLLFSEWASRAYASANFYLLPTRAWELGVGAVCAFVLYSRSVKANQWLSGLGLVLLGFAMIVFDDNTPFPSLYALVPVVGTAMIILFAADNHARTETSTCTTKLLSCR